MDVLEQGRVPILFSIEQMRNLNMTTQHTTTGDYITCDSFGLYQKLLPMAPSGHAMLDLSSVVQRKYPRVHIDDSQTWSFTAEALASSSPSSTKKPGASVPYDPDKEVIIGRPGGDHWIHTPGRAVLIRQHRVPRKNLYVPTKKECPLPIEHLKPERHTEAKFENEEIVHCHHHDNCRTKDVAPFEKMWTGRIRFIIDPEQIRRTHSREDY